MQDLLMISNSDEDFGLVPAADAAFHAQTTANKTGAAVFVHDPVTDDLVGTYEPVLAIKVGFAPEGRARRMAVVAARRALV